MPPLNSTGGDLVDQLREWFDRQRERLDGRINGANGRTATRRPTRRSTTRAQAVPLGSARTTAGRPNRYDRQRVDRAARGTYTIVLGAVLLILIVVLFYALTSLMPSSSSAPAATPTPAAVAPSSLPSPAPISSPPPFIAPSPSPSPLPPPGLPAPQQRFHVVEGGDTLNRIAQRYGVTVEAIMQANGFTDRNRILRIGERLVIPEPPAASPTPR
jgi:LysM repeat protein